VGLRDIAVTRDGRYLIAVTTATSKGSLPFSSRGILWIYDATDLAFHSFTHLDSLPMEGEGKLMVVSNDSNFVFVRQAGMHVGEYNLLTQQFRRFQVGDSEHLGGEIRDIEVDGNALLVLLHVPDRGGCLHVINTQTHRMDCFYAGMDPLSMKLYRPDKSASPFVVLFDRGDEDSDVFWQMDVYESHRVRNLSLPDGALDYDITDSCEKGMIIYPGDGPDEGLAYFIDLNRFELLSTILPVEIRGEAYVYLSRSQELKQGYVFSQYGPLIPIDLERFRADPQIRIVGNPTGCAAEIK
jgi:hypothetical protein